MIHVVPVLTDNYCYWVICPETKKACLIDCPDSKPALDMLAHNDWDFCTILNTHHHLDHVGANDELLQDRDIPVYGSWYDRKRIPKLSNPLKEGEQIFIGSLKAKVLEVPGHTLGHIAYYFETLHALFCGDTLFVGGCGRLFEGTPEQMVASLKKIMNLPEETLVYCGHEYTKRNLEFALTLEPNNLDLQRKYKEVREKRERGEFTIPSALAEEKLYNPFLRWESSELRQEVQKRLPKTTDQPASVFASIRLLKDAF